MVGFQTCSTILDGDKNVSYGHCSIGNYTTEFKEYKSFMCNLFSTYTSAITSNPKNVGFSFWTYKTGSDLRRIQQWDFGWNVDQGIIKNLKSPPTSKDCNM